jgi:pimeloyl-ACP methyl ester carboxylesterase
MPCREEHIGIPVEGTRIDGTLATPGARIPGVLFVHGWGGSQAQYHGRAREVAALGCVCLTFDLRGHAATAMQRETVSREHSLNDVVAAYDTLAGHAQVDASSIAVVGSSYGGYLAAILTRRRSVRWLALRVPALYVDEGWDLPKLELHKAHDLQAYRRRFVPAKGNRALAACTVFEGDVLIVQSEHDNIVPPPVITSYREACVRARSLTYRCIEGADHGLTSEACQQRYTALLAQWLGEMLPHARRDGGHSAEAAAAADRVADEVAGTGKSPEAPT